MAFHVFAITHVGTGKKFVGSTQNPQRTWRRFRSPDRPATSKIAKAIAKFGADAFRFEVLKTCGTAGDAAKAVEEWIGRLGTDRAVRGYNQPGSSASGGSRNSELARLIAEQRRDRRQDREGIRTIADEVMNGECA